MARGTCDAPPEGWYCSAEKGHAGPCPTYADWPRQIADENPDAVVFDGLDDAIIGIASQYTKPPLLIYDRELIIGILRDRDGMTDEEAREYSSFNIECLWAGDGTPLIR